MALSDLSLIQKRRKLLNLTQNALAQKAGVSQSMIAKVEAGQLDPSYSAAKRILNALDELEHKEEIIAKDILTAKLIAVRDTSTVSAASELMRKHGISQLPVMSAGKIVGLVSDRTILEQVSSQDNRERMASREVREVMETAPPILPESTPLYLISELLKHNPILIITQKGRNIGVITKSDLLKVLKL